MSQAAPINTQPSSPALSGAVPLIGRILLAAIFLISGLGKIMEPTASMGYISSVGLPLPQVALAIGIAVEVIGGLMLIAGYRTRTVAAIFVVYCLATAAFFHSNFADQNQLIHFLKNVAMTGGMLQIVAFGGGRLSVDARRA